MKMTGMYLWRKVLLYPYQINVSTLDIASVTPSPNMNFDIGTGFALAKTQILPRDAFLFVFRSTFKGYYD